MREFLLVLLVTFCALTGVSGQGITCPVDSSVKNFFWTRNGRCGRAEEIVVDDELEVLSINITKCVQEKSKRKTLSF